MTIKPSTLSKLAIIILAVGLVMQLTTEVKMSWATAGQDVEKQTVPTRTPTPKPVTPTVPPPTATHTPAPPAPADTPAPPTPTMTPTATMVLAEVTADVETAVYDGPGSDYTVVGVLEKGDTAVVVGRSVNSSWWQIIFQERTGWVSDADVTANLAAYDAPVVYTSSAETNDPSPEMLPLAGGSPWVLAVGGLLLVYGVLLLLTGVRARGHKR